jgi:2-dehydropantoate 2-reductase
VLAPALRVGDDADDREHDRHLDQPADALASPEHLDLYRALAGEIMAVAAAEGVKPEGFNGFDPGAFGPGGDAARVQRSIDEMVAHNRASAKSHSGIWRDLAVRKRKTEVDAQVAIIAEIAGRHGLAIPITRRLVEFIHDIEDGRRQMSWANLDLLAETAS